MKKLTAALALALTVSLLTSSAVSAAMLKPKNEQKSMPKSSTSDKVSTSDEAESKANAPTVGKTMTIMRKSYKDIGAKIPQDVDDKNGTESIVLTNVTAVKKGDVTLIYDMYEVKNKAYLVDSIIYEIPVGAKIITSSANNTGKAYTDVISFKQEPDGKSYKSYNQTKLKLGETIVAEGDIGWLFCIGVVDGIEAHPGWYTGLDSPAVFVRVVPAE